MSTARHENHPLPQIFKGCRERTGCCKRCSTLPSTEPYLRAIPFQGVGLSRRKENSSQSPHQRLRVSLHYHLGRRLQGSPALSAFKFGNINPIPFQEVAPSRQTNRTNSPMSNCCSHGTFLHYHQDQRQFNPGSHLRLQHYRCTLLHVGPASSARRPGVGATLERHPFSGLVDSAGELLHTP